MKRIILFRVAETGKDAIQRLMELEKPVFNPNPDQFKENFENFKKVVLDLRDQGCRFVTISDYLAMSSYLRADEMDRRQTGLHGRPYRAHETAL